MNFRYHILLATGWPPAVIIDSDIDPVNSDQLNLSFENPEGEGYYRTVFAENIIVGKQDYTTLFPLFQQYKCEKFIVAVYDNNNVFVAAGLTNYYNIRNIDEDNCEFSFAVTAFDHYMNLFNGWETKHNILNAQPTLQAAMDYFPDHEIVIVQVTTTIKSGSLIINAGLPPNYMGTLPYLFMTYSPYYNKNFRCYKTEILTVNNIVQNPPPFDYYTFTITADLHLIAERRYVLISGGTWDEPDLSIWKYDSAVTIGGQQYRKYFKIFNLPYTVEYDGAAMSGIVDGFAYDITRSITYWKFSPQVVFNNCRKLQDVINYLISQVQGMNTGHNSQFFYAATNPVTGEPNPLNNLLTGQKSDFIWPIGSNPATKAMMSLKNLLNDLKGIFPIQYHFDSLGVLTIEHELFYENGMSYGGIQQSAVLIPEVYTAELGSYEINFSKIKGRETFACMEADTPEFEGLPIIYSCPPNTEDSIERRAQRISTDIYYVYNGNRVNNNISDDGLVLLHAEYDSQANIWNVVNGNGILNPMALFPNIELAYTVLHEKYWRHGVRLMQTGTLNGQQTTFTRYNKIKVQKTFVFPFCDITMFKPEQYLVVNGVAGKIVSAKYSLYDKMLEVKLKYEL